MVLPGYTAFSVRDAERAASMLLAGGAVRVKSPLAAGAQDQWRIRTLPEIWAILETLSADQLSDCGLVLERDLSDVTTLSVGHIVLDDVTMTYHGTQRLTRDNEGRTIYGGSDLICVRGGWGALDRLPLSDKTRYGVAQAKAYDDATSAYAGLIASRRNYDVGQGVDSLGQWRSGVFEASWRVGGASTAEAAALAVLMQDTAVDVVEASVVQAFGDGVEAPHGARVLFQGYDPRLGPMIEYTLVTGVLRPRR